jgi:uncharacterized protein
LVSTKELEEPTLLEFDGLHPSELKLDIKKVKTFHTIKARVMLHKTATGISADFEVTFAVDMVCVRCVEVFCRKFHISSHLDYLEGKDPLTQREKIELNRIDIEKVYYRGHRIDLSVGIREAIVLSFPIAPLCRDNCRGLCPVCGVNLNREECNCTTETIDRFTPKNLKVKKDR